MPFILCNLITVILGILLSNDIGLIIAIFKNMENSVTFYEAFVYLLFLVSTFGAIVAQVVGSIYGYLAYREIRDGGITRGGGGEWGNSYPEATESREVRPVNQANNFQAFQGSGQRLGG
ncbi:unnamed protein product [Durusdinium trenchii]|uniref:Uncharacterized protein n=1 Tax=Durusdinium trenchii TaxID=1381693 RepID=A0ABP0P7R1_9DINO|eukprot:g2404.t1